MRIRPCLMNWHSLLTLPFIVPLFPACTCNQADTGFAKNDKSRQMNRSLRDQGREEYIGGRSHEPMTTEGAYDSCLNRMMTGSHTHALVLQMALYVHPQVICSILILV